MTAKRYVCSIGKCDACKLDENWLMEWVKKKLNKKGKGKKKKGAVSEDDWGSLPISFRQYVEKSMTTKAGKQWSYQVREKYETVMYDFIRRFGATLQDAREHITFGYHQQTVHHTKHNIEAWSVIFLLFFKFF